jgi:Tfp pilus assembly protein PilF
VVWRKLAQMKHSQKHSNPPLNLDADELTHLAVKAMRSGRDDDALQLLQRAIERYPQDGNPHHLRGAILASRHQPAQAIEAMTQALTLNPQLVGARFQLGLLHFTSGNVFEAQSVWQPFENLDERHPLRLFKSGMLHLAKDEFEDCIALLEQGIALCDTESINKDMRRVIEKVRAIVPARAPETLRSGTHDNPPHVMLQRYGHTPKDKNEL